MPTAQLSPFTAAWNDQIGPAGEMIELVPIGIGIFRDDGTLMRCNDELVRLFGAPREALRGRTLTQLLVDPPALEDVRAHWRRAAAEGISKARITRGLRGQRDNGSRFLLDLILRPVCLQGQALVLATFTNLSEIAPVEDVSRHVLANALHGVVLVDTNGTIAMTNGRLNAMFGYEAHELLGEKIEMLLPQRLHNAHIAQRDGFIKNPATRPMGAGRDLSGRRKSGTEFPIEISLSTFIFANERLVCAAVTDITERKRSELQLREANAQLEEFAYVAAHDLRSPLRGIAHLIGFIEEDFGETAPPGALRNFQRMRERVAGAEKLIDDLLAYARARRRITKFEPIELSAIVTEIFESHGGAPGTHLVSDVITDRFIGARTPLSTTLRNLVANAIKHHDRAEKNILVRARERDNHVMIDVIDDGPGIPEIAQERVFRLFQTLSKSERSSAGLGLALALRLVNGHGGNIQLLSKDGVRGCVFRVWWPRILRSDLNE